MVRQCWLQIRKKEREKQMTNQYHGIRKLGYVKRKTEVVVVVVVAEDVVAVAVEASAVSQRRRKQRTRRVNYLTKKKKNMTKNYLRKSLTKKKILRRKSLNVQVITQCMFQKLRKTSLLLFLFRIFSKWTTKIASTVKLQFDHFIQMSILNPTMNIIRRMWLLRLKVVLLLLLLSMIGLKCLNGYTIL